MNRRYLVIGLFLFLFVLVLAVFLFKEKPPADALVLYGNVDVRQVDISFRVPGRVAKLFFEEGDVVKEGDLVCVLDKTPYDSQIKQSQANLAEVKANLENAEILLQRRLSLIGIGGVSQEDVDNSLATKKELEASLLAAEATLAVALDNMSYTEVRAPTDGIILSRIKEPGSVVNPTDPIYTLSVSSPIWIRAYVNEPDLGKIYYGMSAEIQTDSKNKYIGKIGFISPVAEFTPKTVQTTQLRTDLVYRLRIYAENPDHFLKQGMPVTVHLVKRHE
jgi:HlyD family secretion protein